TQEHCSGRLLGHAKEIMCSCFGSPMAADARLVGAEDVCQFGLSTKCFVPDLGNLFRKCCRVWLRAGAIQVTATRTLFFLAGHCRELPLTGCRAVPTFQG